MSERIDAHHHLWRYSKAEYDWIGAGMEIIARDFLPADLRSQMASCAMAGSVVVQACHSLAETEWLLQVAADSEQIRGVVGWAPICDPAFPRIFETIRPHKKLKGLRHILQAEPDDEFILRANFNNGISALAGTGLVYDILIYEHHLPATIKFVDLHPNQRFVLDHIAKPRIKDRRLEPWRSNLKELAKRENVYCKLSGLVTEAHWNNWNENDLRPYVDGALEAFGPSRLMFGSDWPVCLLACSYQRWFQAADDLLSGLSTAEKSLVFGGVASKVYCLDAAEPPTSTIKRE